MTASQSHHGSSRSGLHLPHRRSRGGGSGSGSGSGSRVSAPDRADRDAALRGAGRAGFVARGVVYVLVGVLALEVAFGHHAQADRQGALHEVAAQPFGRVMLWLLVAGFACMTLWRASLAVTGGGQAQGGADGRKKTGSRLLNAGRAVFYAFVSWGAAQYAAGSGGQSNGDAKSRDWTATVLGWPGGRFYVGAAGVVLIGVAVGLAVSALRRRFLRKLDTAAMSRRTRQAVTFLGVAGSTARAAVLAGAGVFVLIAAVRFDPGEAKGMDDTLRSFASTPAGPWLLVVVAVGLALFGAFSFAAARWRRL